MTVSKYFVIAGLDPAIHLNSKLGAKMDARIKSGHDEERAAR